MKVTVDITIIRKVSISIACTVSGVVLSISHPLKSLNLNQHFKNILFLNLNNTGLI